MHTISVWLRAGTGMRFEEQQWHFEAMDDAVTSGNGSVLLPVSFMGDKPQCRRQKQWGCLAHRHGQL